MKRKFFVSLLSLLVLFLFSAPVYAAVGLPPELKPGNLPGATRGQEGVEVPEDYAASGIQLILGDIITVILSIAAIIAVFSIINNAWWLAASAGKGEMIDQHKKGLFWSITGLILIILSYVIIRFVIELVVGALSE